MALVNRETHTAPRSSFCATCREMTSTPSTCALPILALLLTLGACAAYTADTAPVASPPSSMGAAPTLLPPTTRLIPTLRIAAATGWPAGGKPTAAHGLSVQAFATGLQHPRWLYTLPNGDVLVAETNAPPRPADGKGIRGRIMKAAQAKAGAGSATANRITLLRDADGDGVAEIAGPFLDGLNSPFGMALVGSTLYVANTDAVLGFPYHAGDLQILAGNQGRGPAGRSDQSPLDEEHSGQPRRPLSLCDDRIQQQCRRKRDRSRRRSRIDLADRPRDGRKRIFCNGTAQSDGMAWEPDTGALWTVVNERDELGNDLVPDYLTSVQDGAFHGWPYSYYGQHVDRRVKPGNEALVARAVIPDYALGAHVAALGLVAATHAALPSQFRNGMFVGEHGSWNRQPLVGYKVVFIPFANGKPAGMPVDVLTGFVNAAGGAMGRPVGVTLDSRGALLVADDVGNTIWRVIATP